MFCYKKDPQESSDHVVPAPSPTRVSTTERDSALARDSSLNQRALAREKTPAPTPLTRDKALVPTPLPRGRAVTRCQELAHDEARDSSAITRDKALVPKALPRDKARAREQARDPSALARDQSESDSDDDAVVVGRSARSKTGNQKKEKTKLNSGKSVESSQRTSAVNKKDPLVENTKTSRGKRQAAKESTNLNQVGDGSEESSPAEGMFDQ